MISTQQTDKVSRKTQLSIIATALVGFFWYSIRNKHECDFHQINDYFPFAFK